MLRESRVDQPEEDMAFDPRISMIVLLLGNKNSLSLPTDDQLQAFYERASHRTTPSITEKSSTAFKEASTKIALSRVFGERNRLPKLRFPRERNRQACPLILCPKKIRSLRLRFPRHFDSSEGVLKLRASKPSGNGKLIPAQASQFYLTTQNLNDLLKGLSSGIGDCRRSSIRCGNLGKSGKKSSFEPRSRFTSVKSILLQAKVGKALTDPFGHAPWKICRPTTNTT